MTPYVLKYTKNINLHLSDELMNDGSSFWMGSYETWQCPLTWLICSGQTFECLVHHFSRHWGQSFVPCLILYHYDALPNLPNAILLQSDRFTLWMCARMGGRVEGLLFSSSVVFMRWKDGIFYAWNSAGAPRTNLCAVQESLNTFNWRLTTQILSVTVSTDTRHCLFFLFF